MSLVTIKGKLLPWGNSFGLRLSRRDVEQLRISPGGEIEVKVVVRSDTIEVSDVRSFHLGGHAADDHDALFEESVAKDHEEERS